MNILRHGDPERTGRLMRFECAECGCEWIAGAHEVYKLIGKIENACHCPECYTLCGAKDDGHGEKR